MGKKEIRANFRDSVFERDRFKCAFCSETSNLDAHHITDRNEMPNGGYVKENGISLCQKHHIDAELFHISGGSQFVEGMHPDDLYAKIKSSKELAIQKSLKLKN